MLDINALDEWRNESYENAVIERKSSMWYDSRIHKGFKAGDSVLLYKYSLRHCVGKLLTK